MYYSSKISAIFNDHTANPNTSEFMILRGPHSKAEHFRIVVEFEDSLLQQPYYNENSRISDLFNAFRSFCRGG